jgi:hypothetical protein
LLLAPSQPSLDDELEADFDGPDSAEVFEPASLEPLDAPSPDEPDEPDEAPALSEEPESVAAAAFVLEPDELERSFLAQPEPLKWTDGATNALRSVPSAPQLGQKRGCGASIPWMNSVRVVQFEQM